MTTPLFLDMDRVLRIHQSMIELYGGAVGVQRLDEVFDRRAERVVVDGHH